MNRQPKFATSSTARSSSAGASSTKQQAPAPTISSVQKYEVQKYEVLYYKRTNKVHKAKGVSRMDGILTVHPHPSNLVTLHSNDGTDTNDNDTAADPPSDSDEEESGKMSYNQKMKKMRKKMNQKSNRPTGGKQILYSAKNVEITKRIADNNGGSFNEDEIVILPAWECQIVSVLSNSTSISSRASIQGTGLSTDAGALTNTRKVLHRSNNLLGKKRPLASKSLSSGPSAALKRKAPLKPVAVTGNNHDRGTVMNARNAVVQRKPPAQPKVVKKPQDCDSDSDDSDGEKSASINATCTAKPPLATLNRNPLLKKQTILSSRRTNTLPTGTRSTTGTVLSSKSTSTSSQNDACFQMAIGNLYIPASVKSVLRPHQESGIVFLWNCLTGACPKLQKLIETSGAGDNPDCSGAGAILADQMGLGKTLMTIAIIVAMHRHNRNDRFIVVCPSSLVVNWAKEFDKFIGKASKPKRVVVRKGGEEGLQKIKAFVPLKPNTSEVLIISYDLFRMNSAFFSQSTNIGLLVVDEGHRLKNTSGTKILSALNSLRCSARLLISGTPIQNNLSEFYNVANFVLPGILGDLNAFRREYDRPISASSKKDATNSQKEEGRIVSRGLDKITSAFMIRRLQKDTLKLFLPPRSETLLFCRPSAEQCRLYKELTTGSISDSLSTLTKLRKLCSHPDLLNGPSVGDIGSQDASSCTHAGKLDILEGLLSAIRSENPTDKVIVVSNFTSALTVIEGYILKRKGWTSVRLDGTTEQSTRQTLVDSFNRSSADNGFVFLLSSKAGGCGLNLIGANRLIMYDLDWNPSTDHQAMARIYRQGQKKECFIYRFMTTGTVEEVIFQRQIQKNLLDTIASKKALRGKSTSFTDEELKDCFTLKEQCKCDTKNKVGSNWEAYDGVDSLLEQDVVDKPLLKLAREKPDVLTYVHIVKDITPITGEEGAFGSDDDVSSVEESVANEGDWDCFDEDSEAEFEG